MATLPRRSRRDGQNSRRKATTADCSAVDQVLGNGAAGGLVEPAYSTARSTPAPRRQLSLKLSGRAARGLGLFRQLGCVSYREPHPRYLRTASRRIVWAHQNSSGVAVRYDAGNPATKLYNSSRTLRRDQSAGNKFIPHPSATDKVIRWGRRTRRGIRFTALKSDPRGRAGLMRLDPRSP